MKLIKINLAILWGMYYLVINLNKGVKAMAHFYGTIDNETSGTKSLRGTKNEGLVAHIRGWNKGVRVFIHYDTETKQDIVSIYRTEGSNNCENVELVAKF